MNTQFYEYFPVFKVTGSKGSISISAWFVDVAVNEALSHFDLGIESGVKAKWISGSEPLSDMNAEYDSELNRISRGVK